jgi:hypothetical protein
MSEDLVELQNLGQKFEIREQITPVKYHTIFDCTDCDKNTFNKNNITIFGKDVGFALNVPVVGPPAIGHYDNGNTSETGFFHLQIFERLAQLSGHYVSDTGQVFIDLITTFPIETKEIEQLIEQYFRPKNINLGFIARIA